MFKNRTDAGIKLAAALQHYKGMDAVVYALPRGGVVLGVEIAKALKLPLDLVIPRKIGHPHNPEYAICAVTEHGELLCNEAERRAVDPAWLKQAVEKEIQEATRRRETYLKGRPSVAVEGKTAIIVDDGIATGLTMRAAIKDLRARHPAKVVVAIPVCPADTAEVLRREADELVVLDIPLVYLGAVGAYYQDFPQVSDEEVIEFLKL